MAQILFYPEYEHKLLLLLPLCRKTVFIIEGIDISLYRQTKVIIKNYAAGEKKIVVTSTKKNNKRKNNKMTGISYATVKTLDKRPISCRQPCLHSILL